MSMGSSFSSILSNIFTEYFEENYIYSLDIKTYYLVEMCLPFGHRI